MGPGRWTTAGAGRAGTQDERVLATVRRHAPSLLRVARRYSMCADDAQDAYQRTLEIYLRRVGDLDPALEHRWLHTVVKHEAIAVRRARGRLVGRDDLDELEGDRAAQTPPDERVAELDRLLVAAEALRCCKDDEAAALVLKAEGLSYREIGVRRGWSYTKVNRCLTEGRRRFLATCAAIERGEECERWTPVLSALADGEVLPGDAEAVRPHLRRCPACRAAVRELRLADASVAAVAPRRLAPPGAVAREPAPRAAVAREPAPRAAVARQPAPRAAAMDDAGVGMPRASMGAMTQAREGDRASAPATAR